MLGAPQIFSGSQVIHCDENVLRKLPIQEARNLLNNEWIMIYQKGKKRNNYEIADKIYNNLV